MYEGLLRRERRELHSREANAIESLFPDRLDEHAPALAGHRRNAGEDTKAISYFFSAGRRSRSQGARVEAARFYGQAHELQETDPDSDPADLIDAVIGRVTAGMGFTPAPEPRAWIEKAMALAEGWTTPTGSLCCMNGRSGN